MKSGKKYFVDTSLAWSMIRRGNMNCFDGLRNLPINCDMDKIQSYSSDVMATVIDDEALKDWFLLVEKCLQVEFKKSCFICNSEIIKSKVTR
ncbi:hypothetical protein GJ496_008652, partial [Pomphorhynchus laevis]